jgi:hypothetical protein
MSLTLTPLEVDLLARFHARFAAMGFPAADQFLVSARWNTGAGRFTYFAHPGSFNVDDGEIGLGTYSYLDMEGLEFGASFWVCVAGGTIKYLEIVLNGEGYWDGDERPWDVADPDTGDLPPRGSTGFRP